MTSFLKKLVEHRSKSPQKQTTNYFLEKNGSPTKPNARRDNLPPYAPVCYLPLPPSPIPYHGSKNGSNHSNESFGIHSWNTEPREVDDSVFVKNKVDMVSNGSPGPLMRTRSHSPRKFKRDDNNRRSKCKSKSPQKVGSKSVINNLDYLNSQCHLEGCRADIVVHSTRFMLCRHQLCQSSLFFKDLLGQHEKNKEFFISVSSMTDPAPSTQFRWFVESTIPCPALKDINDETLETCMRLSQRFQAKGLELRCAKYLLENCCNRQPIVVLCWLNWSLKHGFDSQTQMALFPSVACLSLNSLERHRHMLTEKIYSDLVTAKLRGAYEKTVGVFVAIHDLDHFAIDVDICPRCKKTKDGMKIKVFCDPCRKQIGCDRCYQEGCEIKERDIADMQAFFKCSHKLTPLDEATDDCHCQTFSMAKYLGMHHHLRYNENTDEYLSPSKITNPEKDKRARKGTKL